MIREWCRLSPNNEWSGVLFYDINGSFVNNDIEFTAKDFYVLDIGSSTFTSYEMTPEVCSYMIEHNLLDCKTGLIHSHDTMAAFFSGTDNETLKKEGGDSCHYLSLVVNNEGKYVARVTRKITETITGRKKINFQSYDDTSFETDGDEVITERTVIQYFNLNIIMPDNDNPSVNEIKNRYTELKATKHQKFSALYDTKTFGGGNDFDYYDDDSFFVKTKWNEPKTLFPEVKKDEKELVTAVVKKEEAKEKEDEKTIEDEVLDALDITEVKNVAVKILYGNIHLTSETFNTFKKVADWVNVGMIKSFDTVFDKSKEGFERYTEWEDAMVTSLVYNLAYETAELVLNDEKSIDRFVDHIASIISGCVSDMLTSILDEANIDYKVGKNKYLDEVFNSLTNI